jgi:hypothetical protein
LLALQYGQHQALVSQSQGSGARPPRVPLLQTGSESRIVTEEPPSRSLCHSGLRLWPCRSKLPPKFLRPFQSPQFKAPALRDRTIRQSRRVLRLILWCPAFPAASLANRRSFAIASRFRCERSSEVIHANSHSPSPRLALAYVGFTVHSC